MKASVMQLQQRPLVGALELEWPALQIRPELRQGSHAFALCMNLRLAACCSQDEGLVLGEVAPLHRGKLPNKDIAVASEGWISQSRRGDSGGVTRHPLHTRMAIRSAWYSHTEITQYSKQLPISQGSLAKVR